MLIDNGRSQTMKGLATAGMWLLFHVLNWGKTVA